MCCMTFFNKEEKITKNECICGIEMNESKKFGIPKKNEIQFNCIIDRFN